MSIVPVCYANSTSINAPDLWCFVISFRAFSYKYTMEMLCNSCSVLHLMITDHPINTHYRECSPLRRNSRFGPYNIHCILVLLQYHNVRFSRFFFCPLMETEIKTYWVSVNCNTECSFIISKCFLHLKYKQMFIVMYRRN